MCNNSFTKLHVLLTQYDVCMMPVPPQMSYSIVVVALSGLLVQLSLAHYSLYISEDKLQSYYAGSVYEELVQGIDMLYFQADP